jgi:hypothetical protein
MKRLSIALLALALLSACGQTNNNAANTAVTTTGEALNADNAAAVKFEQDAFDFGKINSGDKVTHEFKFTNTGKAPLVITDGYATCGCTKPEWPTSPVKPGETGVVKVTFDSKGKDGLQDKMVTIVGNTIPNKTVVHLIGEVVKN